MKSKKKKNQTHDNETLKNILDLNIQEPNNKIEIFFNLLYLKSPTHYILSVNPIHILKEYKENNKTFNIYESCAILLACNMQNFEIFFKLPSFLSLCAIFTPNFMKLPTKYYLDYIQCLQASILHYIDAKGIKAVIKHLKTLRKNGIIRFHDAKCIESAMQADSTNEPLKTKHTSTQTIHSFAYFSPSKTLLREQLDNIIQCKKILKKIQWANNLVFLCEHDFTKNIAIIGGKQTGKAALLATLLYDNQENTKNDKNFEAISPIIYSYGKGLPQIKYISFNDLTLLQKSPIAEIATTIKALTETFHSELKQGSEKIPYEDIYHNFYPNNKIHIVESIHILRKYNILKYLTIINTPSLIPATLRHLQIYNAVLQSNIILYCIRIESITNDLHEIENDILNLAHLIIKPHIEFLYIIYTKIDSVNLTLKKRQSFCSKLKNAIEQKLPHNETQKQKLLKKLQFHFVAQDIAYAIRSNSALPIESGFDIFSSGISGIEKQLFKDIFNTPIAHHNITILEITLTLCKKNYIHSKRSEDIAIQNHIKNLTQAQFDSLSHNLNDLNIHFQEALKKLPARYSSFYTAFTNLRDNLYSQFIQSINYETKRRTNFNIKRLKTSTIESLIVGLQGLSDILQEHFFNLHELQLIAEMLKTDSKSIFYTFAFTPEHVKILETIFTEFQTIIQGGIFDDSNTIVALHLSNRLDSILPNHIKKHEIQESSVIRPIQESFDYYFSLLERNIDLLFTKKIESFKNYIHDVQIILESFFIHYYQDSTNYEDENYEILDILEHKDNK